MLISALILSLSPHTMHTLRRLAPHVSRACRQLGTQPVPLHTHCVHSPALSWAVEILIDDAGTPAPPASTGMLTSNNNDAVRSVVLSPSACDVITVSSSSPQQALSDGHTPPHVDTLIEPESNRLEVRATGACFSDLLITLPTLTHVTLSSTGRTPLHVDIQGKLEGDVTVSAPNASMRVNKARGESIILQVERELELTSLLEATMCVVTSNASVRAGKLLYESAAVYARTGVAADAAYGSSCALHSSHGPVQVQVVQGNVEVVAGRGIDLNSVTGGALLHSVDLNRINWRTGGSSCTAVSSHGAVQVGIEARVRAFILANAVDATRLHGALHACSAVQVVHALESNLKRRNLNPAAAMHERCTGEAGLDPWPALLAALTSHPHDLKAWCGVLSPPTLATELEPRSGSGGASGKVSTLAPAAGWWSTPQPQQQQEGDEQDAPTLVIVALNGCATVAPFTWGPHTMQ